jgi:YHS domain-containing protein
MLRLLLLLVLFIVVARIFWRVVDNIIEGATGRPSGGSAHAPQRGVSMARDPVCGTFVLPEHAPWLVEGQNRVYFCSDTCREKYRARSADGSGRRAQGRTA